MLSSKALWALLMCRNDHRKCHLHLQTSIDLKSLPKLCSEICGALLPPAGLPGDLHKLERRRNHLVSSCSLLTPPRSGGHYSNAVIFTAPRRSLSVLHQTLPKNIPDGLLVFLSQKTISPLQNQLLKRNLMGVCFQVCLHRHRLRTYTQRHKKTHARTYARTHTYTQTS